MSTTPHPLSITDREAPFLPDTLEEVADLADRLEALGEFSPALVNGCVAWLALKATGRKDRTADRTRAKYRKMLVRLAEVDPPGPRRRSQAGLANVLALAGVTATAAVGAVTKNPKAAAMAAPALLYITYTAGDDDLAAPAGGDSGQSLHNVCALNRPDIATSYTLDKAA